MDPKILTALDEISAILKKHDMAGIIIVSNNDHCDYRMEIEPTWSCARLEPLLDGTGACAIRIKASSKNPGDDQKLTDTVGTLAAFHDTLRLVAEQNGKVLHMIGQHIDFTARNVREF